MVVPLQIESTFRDMNTPQTSGNFKSEMLSFAVVYQVYQKRCCTRFIKNVVVPGLSKTLLYQVYQKRCCTRFIKNVSASIAQQVGGGVFDTQNVIYTTLDATQYLSEVSLLSMKSKATRSKVYLYV